MRVDLRRHWLCPCAERREPKDPKSRKFSFEVGAARSGCDPGVARLNLAKKSKNVRTRTLGALKEMWVVCCFLRRESQWTA